jgi:2-polyprenyl-6-methoxyphenol hydroxylase-like FAD-dependent oxidoreductase
LYYRLRANFDGLGSNYCNVPKGFEEGGGTGVYLDECTVEDVQYDRSREQVVLSYRDSKGVVKKMEADLVIGTDGPSSKIRQIFLPDVERQYVGYIGWRGTVQEKEISEESKKGLSEIPTLCPIGNSCSISSVLPHTILTRG